MAVVATALAVPASAGAAALVPLAPASSWGSSPVHAASPAGDPRLFVVERAGSVRVVEAGALLPTPFLTVPNVDTSGERGLLSIAFAPDYASSGFFYVFSVANGPDAFGGAKGDLRVLEYRRSDASPNLADPGSARLVLAIGHASAANHNGGQLAFGPDGMLYVSTGDAAVAANAQALGNDLGKILRIDPRGGFPYAVPFSNPFLSTPGARPEIYALGLRNPYRFSFAPNGDLVLPDVGSTIAEEVNLGRATGTAAATTLAGANLAWPNCEGACVPPNPSFVDPIYQYAHDPGPPCWAAIGGHVVRDPALAGLTGRYLFGDLCAPDLRTLDLAVPGADPRPAGLSIPPEASLLGFGEDGRGCVYVLTSLSAYRVAASPEAGAACPAPDTGGPGGSGGPSSAAGGSPPPAPTGSADRRRPRLSLDALPRQPLRRAIRLAAGCDEACALRASGSLAIAGGVTASVAAGVLLANRATAPAGKQVRLRLMLRRGALRRARAAVADRANVALRLRLLATDAAGNETHRHLRIRLVPPRIRPRR